jgi:prolyl-tRNA synthetase
LSDEKGIVWPEAVAPFSAHLLRLGDSEKVNRASDELYNKLTSVGVEVLYDDRDLRPGDKFADADLLGMPVRLVVSEKTLAEDKVEIKNRNEKESKLLSVDEILRIFSTTK